MPGSNNTVALCQGSLVGSRSEQPNTNKNFARILCVISIVLTDFNVDLSYLFHTGGAQLECELRGLRMMRRVMHLRQYVAQQRKLCMIGKVMNLNVN